MFFPNYNDGKALELGGGKALLLFQRLTLRAMWEFMGDWYFSIDVVIGTRHTMQDYISEFLGTQVEGDLI